MEELVSCLENLKCFDVPVRASRGGVSHTMGI